MSPDVSDSFLCAIFSVVYHLSAFTPSSSVTWAITLQGSTQAHRALHAMHRKTDACFLAVLPPYVRHGMRDSPFPLVYIPRIHLIFLW